MGAERASYCLPEPQFSEHSQFKPLRCASARHFYAFSGVNVVSWPKLLGAVDFTATFVFRDRFRNSFHLADFAILRN